MQAIILPNIGVISADDIHRIFGSPPDKVSFKILQAKFFHEIRRDELPVRSLATGIYVNTHELTMWKSVNADMRFGHHHETAPAPGIFDAIVISFINLRGAKNIHADFFGKFFEAFQDEFFVIELFEASTISIQCEMLAEIARIFISNPE